MVKIASASLLEFWLLTLCPLAFVTFLKFSKPNIASKPEFAGMLEMVHIFTPC